MFYVPFGLVYKMATLESTTETVVRKVGVKGFEHYQQLIVYCLMKKQDCVGILPTRYGKSPPYQAYLPLFFYGVITLFSLVMGVAILSFWIG